MTMRTGPLNGGMPRQSPCRFVPGWLRPRGGWSRMASLGECLPPIRPADFRRGSGCLQNRLLLLQRQAPVSEAVQRPLDDPRLQRHPGCFAITVELSGHAQWPEGGVDTSGTDNDQDDLMRVLSQEFPAPDSGCPSHLFHPSQKPWNFASPPDTLSGMHKIIEIFADRAALHTEILALRQQVAVLKRKRPRPSLRKADRVFWVILSCLWPGWRHALVIVRPETVIGWHRKGFRLFWTWKSRRGKPGRPPVSREIRDLVRRMSRENTRWGAPRIHGELLKLGFSISQAAVSKYMVRYPSPPSQSWRTFLTNHADCLASIDFFVVPTATFHLLFGFIVLHHERRQIVHFGVTANPTMAWVAQQIREAFPWGTAPRYLIRDRDGAYGQSFRSTVTAMGVEEVVTAPRSPWQNPYVERLIGSVRRECLDHSIILNERHLRRILGSYLDYYHGSRTHLSIGKDTPDGRPVQPAGSGTVVSLPKVGGLHHRYERLAA